MKYEADHEHRRKTFKSHIRQWLIEGLSRKFVAISGEKILGFADTEDKLPDDGVKFMIRLPTAGAWANDKELLDYFYADRDLFPSQGNNEG